MKKSHPQNAESGFALIVTLSLMVLLTAVAVGLLSLSSITIRASGQGSAGAIARGNARMAMMLALGDLQVSMGIDRAASATASAVYASPKLPRVVGAWKYTDPNKDSWHWKPTTTGAPPFSNKDKNFSRWLVSTKLATSSMDINYASTASIAPVDQVYLVGSASPVLKDAQDVDSSVIAEKVNVTFTTQPGKFGYAVFDDSQKASINIGDPTTTPNVKSSSGIEIASRTAPYRLRADSLDSNLASALNIPVNLISMESASIPFGTRNADITRRFNDFTPSSLGLMTDTAYGGLKTDLTSLFEAAPVFDNSKNPPTPTLFPTGFFPTDYVYPDDFKSSGMKWSYLRDHYRKYIPMTAAADAPSSEPSYPTLDPKVSDLIINRSGLDPAPATERLLPVISKFQLVFSIVGHWPSIKDRQDFLNTNGAPDKDYHKYAAIHLAYDPVITLYNPYDVTLKLKRLRVRIWDPPVGFRFTKVTKVGNSVVSSVYFRPGGEFLGLARFQRDNQTKTTARKFFTLVCADGTSEVQSSTLTLRPGEVKVFSPRVEKAWTWFAEVGSGGGYSPKTFFDWQTKSIFGNTDLRTSNKMGVEAVPGWRSYAGLQTDHLATDIPARSAESKYAWEAPRNDGFVTVRYADEVKVEAKPMVTSGESERNFQIDILAGENEGTTDAPDAVDKTNSTVSVDTLRSYKFNFASTDLSSELSDPANPDPVISFKRDVLSLTQEPTDQTGENKGYFAMLEMTARTTKGALNDGMPWLYNNIVVEGGEQKTATVGLALQSYDLRLRKISSVKSDIQIDKDTNNGYFGASDLPGTSGGESFVPMFHVPVAPAASLGDLVFSNLASSSNLPRVVHPFGSSRAHPLIPAAAISKSLGTGAYDHSYLLNEGLWDSYYFSSLIDYSKAPSSDSTRSILNKLVPARDMKDVLNGVFVAGSTPPLNPRLTALPSDASAATVVQKIIGMSPLDRSRKIAKYAGVKGAFNLNSTSIEAWQAVLASLRDRQINGFILTANTDAYKFTRTPFASASTTPFVRMAIPLAPAVVASQMGGWGGFRSLTDDQIKDLAKSIVTEIKASGAAYKAPAFSVSEFVNRRPGGKLHELKGLLETAIDNSSVNAAFEKFVKGDGSYGDKHAWNVSAAAIAPARKTGIEASSAGALTGASHKGAPPVFSQADIMAALAPVATVRGDTFTIRAYGEALSKDGNTTLAKAWCEAVVQRNPDFVDPREAAETKMVDLRNAANIQFGRRFAIRSFRWLNEKEV